MSLELFFAWLTVMFPLVFSPGPANIVLAIAGANSGFRRSLPLVAGIDLVFVGYSLLIGFGLGALIRQYPQIYAIAQYAGAAYLAWLAWSILTARKTDDGADDQRTLGFKDGVLIQALNPKGWIMLLLMFSLFVGAEADSSRILWLCFWLMLLNVSVHLLWLLLGRVLLANTGRWLTVARQNQLFAVALLGVSGWVVLSENPLL